jgi:integral membrane sensor domain MASE1
MIFNPRQSAHWMRLLLFSAFYLLVGAAFLAINRRLPIGQALWPYTGIGLAGVLLFGFRILPLILILKLAIGLWVDSPASAAANAVAEVLEVSISAWLLHQLSFKPTFPRMSDAVKFLLAGAATGPLIGTGLKQLINLSFQHGGWSQFIASWWGWCRGDILGVILFTPLVLSWVLPPVTRPFQPTRTEGTMLALSFVAITLMILFLPEALPPGKIPPLLGLLFILAFWAALRFGLQVATTVAFV